MQKQFCGKKCRNLTFCDKRRGCQSPFLSDPSPIIGYACHSLTPWRLVNLMPVNDVADVDAEDHIGNSLLQIWEPTFGPKAKLLFTL